VNKIQKDLKQMFS